MQESRRKANSIENLSDEGSIDHSKIGFQANSELGYIFPDLFVGPNRRPWANRRAAGGGLVSQGREKPNGRSQAGDVDGAADSACRSEKAREPLGVSAQRLVSRQCWADWPAQPYLKPPQTI